MRNKRPEADRPAAVEAGVQAAGIPRRGAGRAPGRVGRAPLLAGLGVSALVHVLVIVLYPFLAGRPLRDVGGILAPAPSEPAGMRAINLVETAAPDVGDPEDPPDLLDPGTPDAAPEAMRVEDGFEAYVPERHRSAAERLRAGEGDPRLWQPIDPALVRPTRDEVLRLRLAAAVEASNDSIAAEAARQLESMDWTHTDADGGKWGVSPGKIHLGDIEIPLPFGFGPPPDYSGDRAEWAFRMADIERAAGTLAARMSWKERSEVMRRRREERREREEAEKAAAAAAAKPDTTSGAPRRR